MIYILYSDDYEVFLGGNHLPEKEVLIRSTENVLSACEDIGVPMTLFCDMACLWRYRELGYPDFPEQVEQQLKDAIGRGHDVQTHIHPHWLDTQITFGEKGETSYNFDLTKFLLGNWKQEDGSSFQEFCADIFKRAKVHLEDLLRSIDPSYECIAYRAGGYGIQPNTKQIFGGLLDAGYLIDSSIVPGMIVDSNVNHIDFRQVPKAGNYFVSAEQGIQSIADDGVFEIPVLALREATARWVLAKNFIRKVTRYFVKPKKPKPLGYAIQVSDTKGEKKSALREIFDELKKVRRGWMMLELGDDASLMVDATRKYISQNKNSEIDLFVSVSCHSKSTHPAILDAFKKYHNRLKSIYGDELKAITFQEAAHLINATVNSAK
ncbi:MAG: hypothetical protein HQ508_02785 [Candidatus Marinimicrobia bacterium]|nr:hypothetical protein [Candidatus Neomarinimicrobiota bacterium]